MKMIIPIVVASVISLFSGAVAWNYLKPDSDQTAENLSDAKISRGLCTPAAVTKFGPSLCRELECNRASQGNAGRPVGCDAIANVNNTKAIWEHCDALDGEKREKCFTLYRERK